MDEGVKAGAAAPTADEIFSEACREVRIAGKVYAVRPPKLREVREFRRKLLPLDARVAAAAKAARENPGDGDALLASREATDALVELVLRSVEGIDEDWLRIMEEAGEDIEEELQIAFEAVYWWYLDPLAKKLVRQRRAKARVMMAEPSKSVSSPTS